MRSLFLMLLAACGPPAPTETADTGVDTADTGLDVVPTRCATCTPTGIAGELRVDLSGLGWVVDEGDPGTAGALAADGPSGVQYRVTMPDGYLVAGDELIAIEITADLGPRGGTLGLDKDPPEHTPGQGDQPTWFATNLMRDQVLDLDTTTPEQAPTPVPAADSYDATFWIGHALQSQVAHHEVTSVALVIDCGSC